jgi:carbonic anhydrase
VTDEAPSPAEALSKLLSGNQRFAAGQRSLPNQDAGRRASVVAEQNPFALIFGCSDSRVAAEIVFDRGLGDLFVVRTAGHVVDSSVLGSIEFGVGVLNIPLVVVLGHDSCGAVKATLEAYRTGELPGGYLRTIVELVTPSVLSARRAGHEAVDDIESEHVRQTVGLLATRSALLAERIADGRCAVVGMEYSLSVGEAHLVAAQGPVPGENDDDQAGRRAS